MPGKKSDLHGKEEQSNRYFLRAVNLAANSNLEAMSGK